MQVLNRRIYGIMAHTMFQVHGRHVNPCRVYFTKRRNKFPYYAAEEVEWPNWLQRRAFKLPERRSLQLTGVGHSEADAFNFMLSNGSKRVVPGGRRALDEYWTEEGGPEIRKIVMQFGKDQL